MSLLTVDDNFVLFRVNSLLLVSTDSSRVWFLYLQKQTQVLVFMITCVSLFMSIAVEEISIVDCGIVLKCGKDFILTFSGILIDSVLVVASAKVLVSGKLVGSSIVVDSDMLVDSGIVVDSGKVVFPDIVVDSGIVIDSGIVDSGVVVFSDIVVDPGKLVVECAIILVVDSVKMVAGSDLAVVSRIVVGGCVMIVPCFKVLI